MGRSYHDGQRALQDRFDTRRLADRLDEATSDRISDAHRAFIESRDMFFLATADRDGMPQCSYKGGDPGFVRVVDERTIAFPVYDGNGMFLSTGNIAVNPTVGILFIDSRDAAPACASTASPASSDDDPLVESLPGSPVRRAGARARRCSRTAAATSTATSWSSGRRSCPRRSTDTPVPDWKLDPWFEGTLPADDPAHDPDHPVGPAIPQF